MAILAHPSWTLVQFDTLKSTQKTLDFQNSFKEYIVCFRQAGFQLVPESRRFKTLFAEQFVEPEPVAQPILAKTKPKTEIKSGQEVDSLEEDTSVVDQLTPVETDPMVLPYIYVHNLDVASFSVYFPDSTVNFKVDLKNGFKEGLFT